MKAIFGFLLLTTALLATPPARAAGAACPTARVTLVKADAGRVDWGPTRVAFDRKNSNGCYDVYTMATDGTDEQCITCRLLPWNRNRGQPAYHPSGRYVIFQAEKPEHGTHVGEIACGLGTNPGAGVFNDIWYTDLVTGRSQALVSATVPYGTDYGVLHPHVSPDGKKLSWSQMYQAPSIPPAIGYEAGKWALMIADLKIDVFGRLSISTPRQLLPAPGSGEGFVENHGYTPDGQALLFSANFDYQGGNYGEVVFVRSDIHLGVPGPSGPSGPLTSSQITRLTSSDYNEHGFLSPRNWLSFMSTRWNPWWANGMNSGTEFTIITPEGAVCQLSHFNSPGYPESQSLTTVAADQSWSPDGKSLLGYSHTAWGDVEQLWRFDFRD